MTANVNFSEDKKDIALFMPKLATFNSKRPLDML